MLDFLLISSRIPKKGTVEIFPKFVVGSSSDLMIRGGDFYAVWDEKTGLWSTSEQTVINLVDEALDKYAAEHKKEYADEHVKVMHMWDADTGSIDKWHKFCQKQSRDDHHPLDENLIFSNMPTTKGSYASKRLNYPLEKTPIPAWDELISTLYSPDERRKIEWSIGAIVTGASKDIQKFVVMYGAAGTGKSTILNIIQELFDGYYSVFEAKVLGSANNAFALEAFRSNPLVAINHDGDLSRIEDNTRLNSLVSHEYMTVNEKFKATYTYKFNSFLFMGTNKPVRITDAKSGIIRRLIDISPTGNKIPIEKYKTLMAKVKFELPGIAWHCKEVYLENPSIYDNYIPLSMMGATNDFYNFVLDSYDVFSQQDTISLKQAWGMYKTFCDDTRVAYPYSQRLFKEELKNYFKKFEIRANDEYRTRNLYSEFRKEKFEQEPEIAELAEVDCFMLDKTESLFDKEFAECLAQYASSNGIPPKKWAEVTTKLKDLDTSRLHYVKLPENTNHIVVDFDIKDENGNKNYELNAAEAAKWPETYSELSKGGQGIHNHYLYLGDVNKLARLYGDDIEIKVFTGNSSLRRKLTKCNDIPIATLIEGQLPVRKESKVINFSTIEDEKHLRALIKKNLRKEIASSTSQSISLIKSDLDAAYDSKMVYDVSDMFGAVLTFASKSTNSPVRCQEIVAQMKFKSETENENYEKYSDDRLVFFDVEVKPNRFGYVWKMQGKDPVKVSNPTPADVQHLLNFKLVGFNNKNYDNHLLYGRLLGNTNEQQYRLSCNIINNVADAGFREAKNISYTDIFDFSSKKQSLKKWEIELGVHHQEMESPWDQPCSDEEWEQVMDYCTNDVLATEALWNNETIQADWVAREVLADLAGGTVNESTNNLTTKLIFGKERNPQLVYTDLATGERSDGSARDDIIGAFPGYEFVRSIDNRMHNMYKGTDLGFGGYVYAVPGMYYNVALIDVASLHPHSITAMKYFGEYTKIYEELMETRVLIKHKNYEKAKEMFGGKLAKYLDDPKMAKKLSNALKLALNSCYGLTSAKFDNPMRDKRNVNNIVALRGALFMRELQDEVASRGFTVVHIKTDSIKIADATPELINFCMDFATKYGYTFEHEATYEKMCLVNDAVYIAKYADKGWCSNMYGYIPEKNAEHPEEWTATGTQFQVPYVFKRLFSKEPLIFTDKCETKSVKSALYLDLNEGFIDVSKEEHELKKLKESVKKGKMSQYDADIRAEELLDIIRQGHNYRFVGRCGQFCPIKDGYGGGLLMREQDGKYNSATGASGYRWLESEQVKTLGLEDAIDDRYYISLCNDAIDTINQYGDFEQFVS